MMEENLDSRAARGRCDYASEAWDDRRTQGGWMLVRVCATAGPQKLCGCSIERLTRTPIFDPHKSDVKGVRGKKKYRSGLVTPK